MPALVNPCQPCQPSNPPLSTPVNPRVELCQPFQVGERFLLPVPEFVTRLAFDYEHSTYEAKACITQHVDGGDTTPTIHYDDNGESPHLIVTLDDYIVGSESVNQSNAIKYAPLPPHPLPSIVQWGWGGAVGGGGGSLTLCA